MVLNWMDGRALQEKKRKKLKRWLLTFRALLHEKGKTQALFWPFALQYKTHENDEILKTQSCLSMRKTTAIYNTQQI